MLLVRIHTGHNKCLFCHIQMDSRNALAKRYEGDEIRYHKNLWQFNLWVSVTSEPRHEKTWAICKQQRCRLACASGQSDHAFVICYLDSRIPALAKSKISRLLASLCSWAVWFELYLVANGEDRFSRDEAHMRLLFIVFCIAGDVSG